MANSGFDKLSEFIIKDLELYERRKIALANLEDETIKTWMKELSEKIELLEESNRKLHLKLGGSAFNPVQI